MKLVTLAMVFVIIASFGLKANAQDSVFVQFNVDVAEWAEANSIDLENDTLYVSGSFWGWPEPGTNHDLILMDDDADSVYTYTEKMGKLDTAEYKFFRVPAGEVSSWDYGEAEGTNNRKVIAYGNDGDTLSVNNTWGIYASEIQFNVDMAMFVDTTDEFAYGEDPVYISGSPLGWPEPGTNSAAMMYNMNEDTVFSITLFQDTLEGFDYEYKYFYVPSGEESSWDYGEWVGDPNREFTIDSTVVIINDEWGHQPTGIFDQTVAPNLVMHPNPASSILYIENLKDVEKIEIYSITGQKIKAINKVQNQNTKINVSELKSGAYIIGFFNKEGKASTKKFIKE